MPVPMDLAFRKAAEEGDIISLQELIAVKPNIIYSTTRVYNNTALHIAASKGHTLFVHHFLLHVGRNMELMVSQDIDGDTPLHLAVRAGHLEVVKHLIQYSVWARKIDNKLQDPIIMANGSGDTPLHNAVLHRNSDIALKLLEANPICGHMVNAAMQSPLYIAVRDGLTHVVKKIADKGFYVASTSTHGTALHQSVLGNNIRALEILVNRYEELLELTDSSGNNALHYAAQKNNPRMVSIFLNKSSTLAYKQNGDGHTPLHRAAYYGSAEAAKELLKQFPDAIEMVDYMGQNALHVAARNDKVNVLQLLLKYVLPEEIVNQRDRKGNTPLHHAAMLFQTQSTLLLLNDRRVNPCLVNKDGDSPFALTCRRGPFGMNFCEMNVWKEIESRRCKQHMLTRQQFRPLFQRYGSMVMVQRMTRDILVATLMCMATFAVTFRVPGGYNQHSGTAILGHHRAFKILVICNTISMCSSTVVVLFYSFFLLWKGTVKLKLSMLNWANALIVLSGLTMIMSMLTAVYLTTAPASRLVAYVVIAIGAGTPLLACFMLQENLSRKSMFGSWIGMKLVPRQGSTCCQDNL